MRNLPGNFTMRKDGSPKQGDWFRIVNKKDESDKTVSEVYIYDEIGFWGTTASDFVQQLIKIDASQIDLHLNSPGGEVFDGLAIYNALLRHDAAIHVYVDALAASAASFIAQAGDKIYMARNAQMMIHDGIGICFGNEEDMLDTADTLGKISNNIADLYAQRAGGTEEEWRALMREEVWYSAQEAVDSGLADEVLSEEDKAAEEASNKWDLTFFNYAGRKRAEAPSRVRERLLVTNRAKETEMGRSPAKKSGSRPAAPGNTTSQPEGTGTPEGTPPPPEPGEETPPPEPNEETPPGEGEETSPGEGEETPPGEGEETPPEGGNQPSNRASGVMVNGQLVTDFSAIQNHVSALETAQNEAVEQHRQDFVTDLSESNRIPATQVEKLTTFALSLSPEQFSEWSASYDSAPSQTLFDQHGRRSGNENAPTATAAEATADRIAVLEGTVAMHERTMTPEKVKQTKSYKELEQLRNSNNS